MNLKIVVLSIGILVIGADIIGSGFDEDEHQTLSNLESQNQWNSFRAWKDAQGSSPNISSTDSGHYYVESSADFSSSKSSSLNNWYRDIVKKKQKSWFGDMADFLKNRSMKEIGAGMLVVSSLGVIAYYGFEHFFNSSLQQVETLQNQLNELSRYPLLMRSFEYASQEPLGLTAAYFDCKRSQMLLAQVAQRTAKLLVRAGDNKDLVKKLQSMVDQINRMSDHLNSNQAIIEQRLIQA